MSLPNRNNLNLQKVATIVTTMAKIPRGLLTMDLKKARISFLALEQHDLETIMLLISSYLQKYEVAASSKKCLRALLNNARMRRDDLDLQKLIDDSESLKRKIADNFSQLI